MQLPGLIRPKTAAEYLQVSEKTLAEWRRKGTGPEYRRISHSCVRYRREDIDRWLTTQSAVKSAIGEIVSSPLLIKSASAD